MTPPMLDHDRLEPIDWARRPFRAPDADGPPGIALLDVATPRGGNWAIVPRVPGEILTAAKYNADRQAAVDNDTPLSIDDYSATIAEMQAETNPYPGGAVSQAVSLAGELERLRWVLHQLNPTAPAWYAVPSLGLKITGSLELSGNLTVNGTIYCNDIHSNTNIVADGHFVGGHLFLPNTGQVSGQRGDGTQQSLIYVGGDDNVYVATGLPANKLVHIGSGGYIVLAGLGVSVEAWLTLHKGQYLAWDTALGITVEPGTNYMQIGIADVAHVFIHPPVTLGSTLAVYGEVSTSTHMTLGGALRIPQGQWLYGGALPLISASTATEVKIGTGATRILLESTFTILSGDLYAGWSGEFNVLARNTPKAWARATTTGALVASANISHVTALGSGAVRFHLLPGQVGWVAAVATADVTTPPCFCEAVVQDFQTVDVRMVAHDGTAGGGILTCVMF